MLFAVISHSAQSIYTPARAQLHNRVPPMANWAENLARPAHRESEAYKAPPHSYPPSL